MYGKGGRLEAFKLKMVTRVRVPYRGIESVECACATFLVYCQAQIAYPVLFEMLLLKVYYHQWRKKRKMR